MIDQAKLVAAFHAWTLDKARPLAEHLLVRGDLDADQRGELDRLGPLSDVYSLGATLYCLLTGTLTGTPTVEADDVGEVLRRVQRGDLPAPRKFDPSIDRALKAICLKAMAAKSHRDGRVPEPQPRRSHRCLESPCSCPCSASVSRPRPPSRRAS
jgi:hypothetical protein